MGKREQLLEIMEDAAKGETKATLRARIAALEAQLAEAREALAESDRQAEKLEALLDPHIAWEGKPAKAYAELTEALQKAEADAARMREALTALDRMNRGVDWCDQDEQARRWACARRALKGGTDHG